MCSWIMGYAGDGSHSLHLCAYDEAMEYTMEPDDVEGFNEMTRNELDEISGWYDLARGL